MKKLAIFIILILLSNYVLAWNDDNHYLIIETIYYNLDFSTQQKLNISAMKWGSVVPDKVFHDTRLHHYPQSYDQAVIWLNSAKENYDNGNYDEASYAFGIASHYIADSFVAPHYISYEPYSLHSKFESPKTKIKVNCKYVPYNLKNSLKIASQNEKDWALWLVDKDPKIPEKEREDATKLLFSIAIDVFNASCNTLSTEIVKEQIKFFNENVLIYLALLIIIFLIHKIYKRIFSKTK